MENAYRTLNRTVPKGYATAGRALGAAGTAWTAYSIFTEDYNKNIEKHKEWTEQQRIQHAGYHATVGTGTSLVGGWVGAQAGAYIGTLVCPGVGTLIGGLIGGAIGGWAGSEVGDRIVEASDGE